MAKVLHPAQVVQILREVQGKTTLNRFAKAIGCSEPLLCLVYKGKRNPGPRITEYLGLERRRKVETTYVWK
jgi:hypothetical protein